MQIYSKLGEGHFGVVYKGKIEGLEDFVAIKSYPLKRIRVSRALEAMTRSEKQALSKLRHPNVVKLLQILKTAEDLNYVYEICDGGNLQEKVDRSGVSQEDVYSILMGVGLALQKMKDLGIVHRDIKPENILINKGKIQLADFGLCMIGPPSINDKTKIGSPLFMSPESLKSYDYSPAGDVYSLGLVVAEILTGKLPFASTDMNTMISKKREYRFDGRGVGVEVSPELEVIINKMIEPQKEKRIGIEELIHELNVQMEKLGIPK